MFFKITRIAMCCVFASVASITLAAELHLVVSVPSNSQELVSKYLAQTTLLQDYQISIREKDKISSAIQQHQSSVGSPGPDVYLALGANACSWLLEHTQETPIFAVFTSAEFVFRMREKYPRRKLSSIVMDQPLERLTALAELVLPKGEAGILRVPPWNRHLTDTDLWIEAVGGEEIGNLSRSLVNLLNHSDSLILASDFRICNRNTVKNILLTSYRHGKPIIGYSDKLVLAGSLISTYSTAQDVAEELPQVLASTLTQNTWGEIHFPHDFKIAINWKVAKSLTINLEEEKVLEEKLKLVLGWTK